MKTKYDGLQRTPWQSQPTSIGDAMGYVVCTFPQVEPSPPEEQLAPTRQLITDAPALLAALVKIIEATNYGEASLAALEEDAIQKSGIRFWNAIAEAKKLIGGGE